MHKKLQSDLMSLAHQILQMKNKDDVLALKEISQEVYEKLSMLAFVEEYVNVTPNLEKTKEELEEKVVAAFELKEEKPVEQIKEEITIEEVKTEVVETDIVFDLEIQEKKEPELTEVDKDKVVYDLLTDSIEIPLVEEDNVPQKEEELSEITLKKEEPIEQPFQELEELMFPTESETNVKNDVKDIGERKTISLEEELQDTISVDVMADLFENVQPKSLNDRLATNIQIGLNDRIAFVKNLFDGDQENYNRVISQLNTFKTEQEAQKFVDDMVKPDYNWAEHEELENRFMEIVSRKFA